MKFVYIPGASGPPPSGDAPSYQATGPQFNGSGSVSWPTHVSGDIGVLIISNLGNQADIATPSGWTLVINAASGGSSGNVKFHAFVKTAASSSEPDVSTGGTFTVSQILTVRDATAVALLGSVSAGSTSSVSMISGTTGGTDRLIVGCLGWRGDDNADQISSWTNANLTAITDIDLGHRDNGSFDVGLEAFHGEKATAGAVGTTTATMSVVSQYAAGHLEFS